jgi:katanin p80 WD40 repeat-containing subunit B1
MNSFCFLVICNLVGHKSNVSCSEFHTQPDYLASGSVDSHVRLWDLRRKGCLYTYKGHTGAINSLKFSPDSKWIASASDDNSIKVNFRERERERKILIF